MSDKIPNALTPEEWAVKKRPQYYMPERACIRSNRDGTMWIYVDVMDPDGVPDGGDAVEVCAEDRHALAALALHGQPFGFTWEMVDALRAIIADHEGDSFHPVSDAEITAAHDAVGRIAALLPPREP